MRRVINSPAPVASTSNLAKPVQSVRIPALYAGITVMPTVGDGDGDTGHIEESVETANTVATHTTQSPNDETVTVADVSPGETKAWTS
ncbi:hypothetical protein ACFLWG_00020 [Chloroflexota bacterium]